MIDHATFTGIGVTKFIQNAAIQSGMIGADICTIPYSVMQQLTKHPLTDIGLEKFLADWQSHITK